MTPSSVHAASASAPVPPPEARPGSRRKVLVVSLAVLAALAAGYGGYLYATRFDEGTDDAHVDADVVPLAPRVGGEVQRVAVEENQAVAKGDLLLVIDQADLAARARQAGADRDVARAQAAAADADAAGSEADLQRAAVEAGKAERDLERARILRDGQVIAPEKFDEAKAAGGVGQATLANASARVLAARAQSRLARARVKAAEAALDLARLRLSYTRILAPEDGVISKLVAHEGQIVSPGQPVAELVPAKTYVVANFKETQVGRMTPGQRAVVKIDAYPGVELEGRVESLSGGTGARFSLIPPDDASGNFVRVVERVPVRIAWATPPPPNVRMQAGLSAYVTVHER